MPGEVQGKVVEITPSGSLITDIAADQLRAAPRDETVTISCDEHLTSGIFPVAHGQPESTFLAYLGPRGVLELDIVGIGAGPLLGIRVGEKVVVKW